MKTILRLAIILLLSCNTAPSDQAVKPASLPIQGTWKLLSGTLTEKDSSTVTDYTTGKSFIKIINNTHFAFLMHDLQKGKDSAAAAFSSGGGSYTLHDSSYTEHLEYCNDRQWEGNTFKFTITIHNDTLIQRGVEEVESLGVNRINVEKYIRVKE